jgi:transcriptional regulator of heat shock response
MSGENKENAVIAFVQDPKAILTDGVTGNEPFFNTEIMRKATLDRLKEHLDAMPNYDLTKREDREAREKYVKGINKIFTKYDDTMKVIKEAFLPIPKLADAARKAVKDIKEPWTEKELKVTQEITDAINQINRWRDTLHTSGKQPKDLAPIPASSKYDLENGLQALKDKQPHPCFDEGEIADFWKYKNEYIEEWEKCLNRLYLEEKTKREAEEKQRQEAERLRKEREQLEAEAKKQREAQVAIEAEQRRLAREQAELERQKQQAQQAAVNPPQHSPTQNEGSGGGAPSALTEEAKKEMRREATKAMESLLDGIGVHTDIALQVCRAIYECKIPHVRFCYD